MKLSRCPMLKENLIKVYFGTSALTMVVVQLLEWVHKSQLYDFVSSLHCYTENYTLVSSIHLTEIRIGRITFRSEAPPALHALHCSGNDAIPEKSKMGGLVIEICAHLNQPSCLTLVLASHWLMDDINNWS